MVETRVVYLEPGKMTIEQMKLPPIKPSQVLVKTHQASICGSERYYYRGIIPPDRNVPMGPMGHEGGGTIEKLGSAVEEYVGGGIVEVGDRVGSFTYPTYSDYYIANLDQVQPIPEGVSMEVGCLYEPLSCVIHSIYNSGVKIGDNIVVNGCGFAGQVFIQGLKKMGAFKVIAVDLIDSKLKLAKKMGADITINAAEEDPVERVLDHTEGKGADVAVDAVGGEGAGIKQSIDQLKHEGILVLYGDNYVPINEISFHRIHVDAIDVRSTVEMHHTHLEAIVWAREAYVAVSRGMFDIEPLLTHTYSLDQLPEVFKSELTDPTSIKTVIKP